MFKILETPTNYKMSQTKHEVLDTENEPSTFDDILKIVGDNGKFQCYFNWIFNFYYTVTLTMTYLNQIFTVATPEHWCYVPGRPKNMTIEQWRTLTIPPDINTKGEETFSKCFMYKNPFDPNRNTSEIIGCQNGWEYNRTWYDETFTTSQNWVCNDTYYVTHSLIMGRVGDFVGTLIFGHLGDIIGRRPIFLLAVFGMFASRVLMLVTISTYYLFMIASFLGYITMTAGFRPPVAITLEISSKRNRAMVVSLHYIAWAVGECILPLVMWSVRRADYYIILTSTPGILVLIIFRYLIESPRWLLNRHKIEKCHKQLKVIAKVNKKYLPPDMILKLQQMTNYESVDKVSAGFLSLLSHWRLAKNTLILTMSWSISFLCQQVLIYYNEILPGNPFLNFFLQAIIQFPGSVLGKILCDRYGRRFASLASYLGTIVATLGLILLIKDTEHKYVPAILAIIVKFFSSMSHYISNLQALEIYPTSLRQTGSSFCVVCGLATAISVPYIALLGKTYDAQYPYIILCVSSLVAGLSGTFLPETKNQNLPETLNEARIFGAQQSYFNFFKV